MSPGTRNRRLGRHAELGGRTFHARAAHAFGQHLHRLPRQPAARSAGRDEHRGHDCAPELRPLRQRHRRLHRLPPGHGHRQSLPALFQHHPEKQRRLAGWPGLSGSKSHRHALPIPDHHRDCPAALGNEPPGDRHHLDFGDLPERDAPHLAGDPGADVSRSGGQSRLHQMLLLPYQHQHRQREPLREWPIPFAGRGQFVPATDSVPRLPCADAPGGNRREGRVRSAADGSQRAVHLCGDDQQRLGDGRRGNRMRRLPQESGQHLDRWHLPRQHQRRGSPGLHQLPLSSDGGYRERRSVERRPVRNEARLEPTHLPELPALPRGGAVEERQHAGSLPVAAGGLPPEPRVAAFGMPRLPRDLRASGESFHPEQRGLQPESGSHLDEHGPVDEPRLRQPGRQGLFRLPCGRREALGKCLEQVGLLSRDRARSEQLR